MSCAQSELCIVALGTANFCHKACRMSAAPVSATGIDTLPEMLVHRIFTILSPADLSSAFAVCKDWHKLGERSNTSLIRSVVPCCS